MSEPLWKMPIPVLGVTGEFASGKTIFLTTISPGQDTLVFDTEKSSESYVDQIGFKRIDVPLEMLKRHPQGYKPINTFVWWQSVIREIPPGKFRVIAIDVAEEIEAGLSDWVWENPLERGRTKAQYLKMSGLFWGDVKALWKSILADLASKCETFAFATHMGKVWAGEKPTDKNKPKGKSTLMELASLYLQLERPKDSTGGTQPMPSGIVLKTRLSRITVGGPSGAMIEPILPPRLPIATPAEIRRYIEHPADYRKLIPDEKVPDKPLTDEQKTELRTTAANAEADAERLRIERMGMERQDRERERREHSEANGGGRTEDVAADPEPEPATPPATTPAAQTPPTIPPVNGTASNGHAWPSLGPNRAGNIHALWEELCHLLGLTFDQKESAFKPLLAKHGANKVSELSETAMVETESRLLTKLKETYTAKGLPIPPF